MKEKMICVHINWETVINYPDKVIDYQFYRQLDEFRAEVLDNGYIRIIKVDLSSVKQFSFELVAKEEQTEESSEMEESE